MKKILAFINFILLFSALIAQDTLTIQTFEFSDITKRRGWYEFPEPNQNWEKILMEYTIKCDPQTTADGFACGEWDYTTYTNVYNYTGELDSVIVEHPEYIVHGLDPLTFSYHENQVYDTYQSWQVSAILNATNSESEFQISNGSELLDFVFNASSNSSISQFIVTSSEAISSGLSAGDIERMTLEIPSIGDPIDQLKISMANSSESEFDDELLEEDFTTVFSGPFTGMMGENSFQFIAPFNWDGSSNIVIQLEFDGTLESVDYGITGSETGSNLGIHKMTDNGFYKMEQGTYINVPAEAFNDLDSAITISLWHYGDPDLMPMNSWMFEGVNENNDRVLNVHCPWGNGQVYWDAGQSGGYDRINKQAADVQYEGQWNHWVFTKNVETGEMKMYLNGNQWHSGSNKNRTMDGIVSFKIGTNKNAVSTGDFPGFLDEFAIWKKELSSTTISEWMNKTIDENHPDYDDLLVYYSFDDPLSTTTLDQSGNGNHGNTYGMPIQHFGNNRTLILDLNLAVTQLRPNFTFYQGDYDVTIDSILVEQTIEVVPTSFQVYSDTTLLPGLTDVIYGWEREYGYTYNPEGEVIDSTFYGSLSSVENDVLSYWNSFELVETIQLANYVTPYGIGLNLGSDGWTYILDVTDYEHYLTDSVDIRAHNTQELLDLKFHFIEGTPARDLISSQIIWSGEWFLEAISENGVLPPQDVQLNPLAAQYKIKTRATGHGFGSGINCSEFCQTWHFINVNGNNAYQWLNWTECADNPIIDQGGTWIYDRAGWCPGAFADTYDYDITPFVNQGEVNTIEYGISPVSIPDGSFRIAFQLFEYGDINFETDAEVTEVLAPSNADPYNRFNPICGNAIVEIGNRGANDLTSADLIYNINGGSELTFNWTGDLAFGERELVTLPINDPSWWGPTNKFEVRIENPNGTTDDYMNNNHYTSTFNSTPMFPDSLEIRFNTNSVPSESSWKIFDELGNIVFQKSFNQANVTHRDTIHLNPGCYRFLVEDSGDDGLSFFANNDGSGYVRIRDVYESTTLVNFNPNFGKFIDYQFTIGYTTGIPEYAEDTYIYVYPNPATHELNIEMDGFIENQISVMLYNSTGKVVNQKILTNTFDLMNHTLDVSHHPKGFYYLQIASGTTYKTKKIILH